MSFKEKVRKRIIKVLAKAEEDNMSPQEAITDFVFSKEFLEMMLPMYTLNDTSVRCEIYFALKEEDWEKAEKVRKALLGCKDIIMASNSIHTPRINLWWGGDWWGRKNSKKKKRDYDPLKDLTDDMDDTLRRDE